MHHSILICSDRNFQLCEELNSLLMGVQCRCGITLGCRCLIISSPSCPLRKKVPIPDSCCVFRHKFHESDFHLFKQCEALELFLMAMPLTFSPSLIRHALFWIGSLMSWLISHGSRLIYFLYVCGLFGLRGKILFGKLGVSCKILWNY